MASAAAEETSYLLAAGAILPANAKVKDAVLDVLESRAYTHPALHAPMVRLCPAKVSGGVDIAMELLGFDAPTDTSTLGQVRREKLGFPGWALVHDEKNARYALDVLSDLKKATRRIKSKPGFAKESIDEIGKTLAGSVPHFLPSFYEEAALSFIEFDNLKYAQQYFEAARRAEREYSLEVDDELREQSFVDFALSGALSVKSLSNFADELAERGKDGLESYLRVCIRRTTGGLPPSPQMLKDLKSLAKAAKENGDEVHVRFIDAILESPALATAAAGFFKAAKKALEKIAKGSTERRALILDLFPNSVKTEDWMPVLEGCGALHAVVDPEAEGQSQLSTAAWFTRALTKGDSPILRDLLVKAKGRLVSEGEALIPAAGRWWGVNIGFTELCLSQGVPISFDKEEGRQRGFGATIDDWAEGSVDEDLPCIAADPKYRELFIAGCRELSQWDFNRAAKNLDARPHYAEMLGEGLTQRLERLGSAAVPALKETLGFLGGMPQDFWGRYPAMHAALEKVDVASSLARTFQIGVFAELFWPKASELQEKEKVTIVGWFDQAPHVVLFSEQRIFVLDENDEVIFDHEAELEPGEKVNRAIWVQGDLCVGFAKGYEYAGYYWASAPKERGKAETTYWAPKEGVALPDGSVFVQGSRMRKGDPLRSGSNPLSFDGERYYAWSNGKMHEFDPEKSRIGEERWPAFLTAEGDEHYRGWVTALGVPEGACIRGKDGIVGLRYRSAKNGRGHDVEDVVGPAGWTAAYNPAAVLLLPHSDTPRILSTGYRGSEIWCEGVMGSDDDGEYHRAPTVFTSMPLLARYRARDPKTSKLLRTIDGEALAALVKKASTLLAQDDRQKGFVPHAEVKEELERLFPDLEDGKLKTVLLGIAHLAGILEARRHEIAEKAPGAAAAGPGLFSKRTPCDPSIPEALGAFAWAFAHVKTGPTLISEVEELRKRFDAPGPDGFKTVLDWGKHIWQLGLGHGTAFLYRYACAPAKDEKARAGIEEYVRAHAAAGFEGEGASKIRISFQRENTHEINQDSWRPSWRVLGDNAVFVWQLGYAEDAWYSFIEHAPDGKFQVVDSEEKDRSGPGLATPEYIDAVVAHVTEHGPLPIEEAVAILCERTGLSPAEATLFACAHWEGNGFGRVKKGHEAAAKFWDNDPFMQPYPTHVLRQLGMATEVWTKGEWKELWNAETLAGRLADVFFAAHPKLPPLTEADDDAADDLSKSMKTVSWIARAGLSDEIRPAELYADRERYFCNRGLDTNSKSVGFDGPEPFVSLLTTALWNQPASAALVHGLPSMWREIRKRMMHPTYFHTLNTNYYEWDGMDAGERERVHAALSVFGSDIPKSLWGSEDAREKPDPKNPCKQPSGDEKVVAHLSRNLRLFAHTQAILDDDPRLGVVPPPEHYDSAAAVKRKLAFIFGEAGDGYIALAEEIAGAEGCAGDPRIGAPSVVAKAAKHFGVTEEAAAYYLMLAGLPKPMDRTVRSITGWDKKTLEDAGKELLEKNLVLEAKRSGSGRSIFLPGAWLKSGIEEWKQAQTEGSPYGDVMPSDPRTFYTAVFARIEGGDVPKFDDPPKRKGKKK